MATDRDVLENAYAAFNARDIDAALATMHGDVVWPNGWEGGHVHGHHGVREYWTRQWEAIDPHVEPVSFASDELGRTVVSVRATVRDPDGNVMSESLIEHVYVVEDGLIRTMEIRHP